MDGCIFPVTCRGCSKCDGHCICSDVTQLECGRDFESFIKATFGHPCGIKPRPRKGVRPDSLSGGRGIVESESVPPPRTRGKAQWIIDSVEHYSSKRDDVRRSDISASEEEALKSCCRWIVTDDNESDINDIIQSGEISRGCGLLWPPETEIPEHKLGGAEILR